MDFAVLDHDNCHDPAVTGDCQQLEERNQQNDDDSTLDIFYAKVRACLADVKHMIILSEAPPGCVKELHTLICKVRASGEQLRALIQRPPRFNF